MQDLEIDVALYSETSLKRHMRFFIPNHDIYRTDCEKRHEGWTTFAILKGIPHMRRITFPLGGLLMWLPTESMSEVKTLTLT